MTHPIDFQIRRVMVRSDAGRIFSTLSWTVLRQAKRVLAPTAVALFVGVGLWSQAAKPAGFEIVAAVEITLPMPTPM
jgi:hypothetical protein